MVYFNIILYYRRFWLVDDLWRYIAIYMYWLLFVDQLYTACQMSYCLSFRYDPLQVLRLTCLILSRTIYQHGHYDHYAK